MITETATVVQVDEDRVVVEAAIKTTCSSCQAQSDCGTGAISRALAPKVQQLSLRSPMPVKVGDKVQVGIPEAGIVSASALLYLLPLVMFIASAVLFSAVLPAMGLVSELWVLLGSVLVTLAGFVALSGWIKKLDSRRFEPVLLAKSQPAMSPDKPVV
ncbi:SoxR reducing system RseC family protein [Alteromonas sp. ASW11-19]|uniref:SoxR reducing system RseC family protein n=1 Tax=Alteromonas salexigens TaxID=2982530 RepID=A0ABT2VS48_9ALTE|nr:SoxR reducing system RseC family protein [Alteromonas salexigens]MCU7555743.1 SoxR reducing system RseC family protein [Alteromonas salexigens]